MSEAKITLGVSLDSYRPKKDKSFSLTFSTQELTPEQVMVVHSLHNKLGILYFADKEVLSAEELTMLDSVDIELEKRSYSQRLRNTLFVLHQQLGGNESNFKEFYERQMEHFITTVKNKLD